MPKQYACLSEVTVGAGGAAGITFSSIPQTYTDLLIKISFRTNRAAANDYLRVVFNSSNSGYSDRNLAETSGTTVLSETNNSTTYGFAYGLNGDTSTANTFGNIDIYIPNYTTSNNKSYSADGVIENNATFNQMALTALLWANTSAITSIYLASHDTSKTLLEHSTATLYGITKS